MSKLSIFDWGEFSFSEHPSGCVLAENIKAENWELSSEHSIEMAFYLWERNRKGPWHQKNKTSTNKYQKFRPPVYWRGLLMDIVSDYWYEMGQQRRQDARSKVIPILSDSFRLWKDFPELFCFSEKSFFKLLGSGKVLKRGDTLTLCICSQMKTDTLMMLLDELRKSVQRPIKINTFIDRNWTLFLSVIYWAKSHLRLLSNNNPDAECFCSYFTENAMECFWSS